MKDVGGSAAHPGAKLSAAGAQAGFRGRSVAESMAQYADLVSLLRAVPLFAGLDPARLKLIAFSSAYLTLADGEVLFYSGETADAVYIVEEGEAKIFVGHGRDEVHVGTVGSMGWSANSRRFATSRARRRSAPPGRSRSCASTMTFFCALSARTRTSR